MKGVVLAGGLGSRMYPLTKVTNKHLLPVYNEPMIYYPIKILVNAGIDDIMIVTGGNNAGEFLKLLGNGADFGLRHLNYTYQEGEGGIAAALSLAEFFADEGKIVVVLGDNIIENNVRKAVDSFKKQKDGAPDYVERGARPRRGLAFPFSTGTGSSVLKKNRRCQNRSMQSSAFICMTGGL